MNEMHEFLWSNFQYLCLEIGTRGDIKSIYKDIIQRYSEKHRKHHGLEHLYYSLLSLHSVWKDLKNPFAVMASIWFHDVIWEPLSLENEDRSAIFGWRILEAAQVDMDFIREMMRLIRFTKHNQIPELNDIDARTIMDIDFICLGGKWEDFQRYNQNVWDELLGHVSLKELEEKRKKFLRSFIEHNPLYLTPFFQRKYESQAKSNLKRALATF